MAGGSCARVSSKKSLRPKPVTSACGAGRVSAKKFLRLPSRRRPPWHKRLPQYDRGEVDEACSAAGLFFSRRSRGARSACVAGIRSNTRVRTSNPRHARPISGARGPKSHKLPLARSAHAPSSRRRPAVVRITIGRVEVRRGRARAAAGHADPGAGAGKGRAMPLASFLARHDGGRAMSSELAIACGHRCHRKSARQCDGRRSVSWSTVGITCAVSCARARSHLPLAPDAPSSAQPVPVPGHVRTRAGETRVCHRATTRRSPAFEPAAGARPALSTHGVCQPRPARRDPARLRHADPARDAGAVA